MSKYRQSGHSGENRIFSKRVRRAMERSKQENLNIDYGTRQRRKQENVMPVVVVIILKAQHSQSTS